MVLMGLDDQIFARQNSCCLLSYAQYVFTMNVIFIFFFNSDGYSFYTYSGLSVYVSNTTNTFDGTLCYKNNRFTFTRPVDISIPCRMNGQYIMLYSVTRPCVKDTCVFSVCEVSVYGNMF